MNNIKLKEVKPVVSSIYLDSAASSKPEPNVLVDLTQSLTDDWYNPSSVYEQGKTVRRKIEIARKQIASLINGEPEHIYFVANGTQANNWALKMAMRNNMVIYTSNLEHPSIIKECDLIQKEAPNAFDCKVHRIPNNRNGKLNLIHLEEELIDCQMFRRTPFVSVMGINNELGIINNIDVISECVHKYGGRLHCDMSQAIGHINIDVKKMNINLMTFTSEKMGMPRGLGVLYIDNTFPITPFTNGGGQERGMVSGTENAAMIIAMGKQCDRIRKELPNRIHLEKIAKSSIESAIKNACDGICDYSINCNSKHTDRCNTIISVCFDGINNQTLMTMLDLSEVQCSAGSACNAGNNKISHVLRSIGLTEEEANNTIRFSWDYRLDDNTIIEFGKRLRKVLIALKDFDN